MDKLKTGRIGEEYAANFLSIQNYEIVCQNYHARSGEIDIITIDSSKSPPQLVFVEVKTRRSTRYGVAQEAITYQKKQKIIKTALDFINTSTKNLPISWRIDGIGIQLEKEGRLKEINHIKNILNG